MKVCAHSKEKSGEGREYKLKKKILILGVGNAQIDAIKYCKEMGLEVHACSYSDTGHGKELVDSFSLIDIKDTKNISEYVQKNEIDIVYSIGSDLAIPSSVTVSEKLNLPCFVSSNTANICKNKVLTRSYLGDEFTGNIEFMKIKSKKDISYWSHYPSILKPADSQGQRGVYKINNENDFKYYFDKSIRHSISKTLIIEEYIKGPEISVNAYIINGKIKFSVISDRITFSEYPGGLVREHRLPSEIITKKVEYRVNKLIKYVIKKFNILNGPVYFQIKLKNMLPKLIEVTPRLDGCHIWRLIKETTGTNLLEITFNHIVYNNIYQFEKSNKDRHPDSYSILFMYEKPGEIFSKNKYKIENPVYLNWYYKDNEVVQPVNGNYEKVGYYIKKNG